MEMTPQATGTRPSTIGAGDPLPLAHFPDGIFPGHPFPGGMRVVGHHALKKMGEDLICLRLAKLAHSSRRRDGVDICSGCIDRTTFHPA